MALLFEVGISWSFTMINHGQKFAAMPHDNIVLADRAMVLFKELCHAFSVTLAVSYGLSFPEVYFIIPSHNKVVEGI